MVAPSPSVRPAALPAGPRYSGLIQATTLVESTNKGAELPMPVWRKAPDLAARSLTWPEVSKAHFADPHNTRCDLLYFRTRCISENLGCSPAIQRQISAQCMSPIAQRECHTGPLRPAGTSTQHRRLCRSVHCRSARAWHTLTSSCD
jgi:hypothetical protein